MLGVSELLLRVACWLVFVVGCDCSSLIVDALCLLFVGVARVSDQLIVVCCLLLRLFVLLLFVVVLCVVGRCCRLLVWSFVVAVGRSSLFRLLVECWFLLRFVLVAS